MNRTLFLLLALVPLAGCETEECGMAMPMREVSPNDIFGGQTCLPVGGSRTFQVPLSCPLTNPNAYDPCGFTLYADPASSVGVDKVNFLVPQDETQDHTFTVTGGTSGPVTFYVENSDGELYDIGTLDICC